VCLSKLVYSWRTVKNTNLPRILCIFVNCESINFYLYRPLIKSLVVDRSLWLIVSGEIWCPLNLVIHQNFPKIHKYPYFLSVASVVKEVIKSNFCNFSLNIICKTCLGTMLPPSGPNWQLIYPNCDPNQSLDFSEAQTD